MTDTNSITPCGYVRTQGEKYFLINPCPADPEWKGEGKSFLVVPDDRDRNRDSFINTGTGDDPIFQHVFPCPRLIVTTNYSVEYDVSIPPIFCRRPVDVQDKQFDELVKENKQ